MSDRFVWPRSRQPWEGPAQYDWLQHELSLRLGSRGRWMGEETKYIFGDMCSNEKIYIRQNF